MMVDRVAEIGLSLDRRADQPLWRQLSQRLETIIRELEPGTQLPSEREISERLRVRRATVQRVFEGLRAKGLVKRERPRGTFVSGLAAAAPVYFLQFQIADLIDTVYVTHIRGIGEGLEGSGRTLMPLLMMRNAPPVETLIQSLRAAGTVGVILVRFAVPGDVHLILRLIREFPAVVMSKEFEEAPVPCCQPDLLRSTGALVRYLVNQGARTLVALGNDPLHTSYRVRSRAFIAAAAALGHPDAVILWGRECQEELRTMMAHAPRPFGVLAPSPGHAVNVRDVGREAGMALGRDLFIATCPPPHWTEDLSGVALAIRDEAALGREAARLLLRHIEGKAGPREVVETPCHVVLPGEPLPEWCHALRHATC